MSANLHLADQILKAIDDAEKAWPHNSHLVEDRVLGEYIRRACNGRQSFPFSMTDQPIQAEVRVVRATFDDCKADRLEEQRMATKTLPNISGQVRCDRCFDPYFKRCHDIHETKYLWVNAGSIIVHFNICPECADQLEASYGPIVWKDGE